MKLPFVCGNCNKKQLLDVGNVHIIVTHENYTDPDRILYTKEVRCKFCGSTDMELQSPEYPALLLRKVFSIQNGISIGGSSNIEGKDMPFSEVEPYIEQRIKEEPENGELRLRHANILKDFNQYEEAIKEYKKAFQLNSNLIAPLINLCEIFYHRSKQYREKEAIKKAREYYKRAADLYASGNADFVTFSTKKEAVSWIVHRSDLYPKRRKKNLNKKSKN